MKRKPIMSRNVSRRTLLKGTAASAAALCAFAERRALAHIEPPKRVVFWYVPEGAAQQAFWPAHGPGALDINLNAAVGGNLSPQSRGDSIDSYRSNEMGGYCLQPLAPHVDDLTLISGLRIGGVDGDDEPHRTQVAAALTGGRPDQGSLDQHLGHHLQGTAPFHAIFSSLYGEHVHVGVSPSYACPLRHEGGGSASPTWNPVTTFNQVFPTGLDDSIDAGPDHRLVSRFEALGSVRRRLETVRCRGGAAARQRMDAYLSSVEQVEDQTRALIESGGFTGDVSVDIPEGWTEISNDNRYWHQPSNFPTMARIQIDTTIAALATDRTRVSLMQFSASGTDNGIDGSHYTHLGIPDLEGGAVNDHHLGHSPDNQRRRNQARIFRWYYEQLAYMIERMKAIPEPDGSTLFDNTLIVACSEFGSYDHRRNDVPYILIGNPTGTLKKGHYLDARNGNFRDHSDLFLAIAQMMGMPINQHGNSNTPYNEIFI